jgi:ETC complex I subunit conserved region
MRARIFKPAKTTMQSGKGNSRHWILEFERQDGQRPDPLMGWSGSGDTLQQLRLSFPTLEAAQAYAAKHGIDAMVQPEAPRALKLQSYADNFR